MMMIVKIRTEADDNDDEMVNIVLQASNTYMAQRFD